MSLPGLERSLESLGLKQGSKPDHKQDNKYISTTPLNTGLTDIGSTTASDDSVANDLSADVTGGLTGIVDFVTMGMFIIGECTQTERCYAAVLRFRNGLCANFYRRD